MATMLLNCATVLGLSISIDCSIMSTKCTVVTILFDFYFAPGIRVRGIAISVHVSLCVFVFPHFPATQGGKV